VAIPATAGWAKYFLAESPQNEFRDMHLASVCLLQAAIIASVPVSQFIEQFHAGGIHQSDLFLARNEAQGPDTILFSITNSSCESEGAYVVNADGSYSTEKNCVPIVGFCRQDTINKFEMVDTGRGQALVSSKRFHHRMIIQEVTAAPTLLEMAEKMKLNPSLCLPEQRDILHDANEILCFALGYKHILIRQRLNSAVTHGATLNGAPFGLFTPYAQVLLKLLLDSPSVWKGVSRNHYQFWEEAYVFAHPGYEQFAERLVEMKVQDASIPAQPNQESTLGYILAVGMLLGYPQDAVKEYAEHMMPAYDLANPGARDYLLKNLRGLAPPDPSLWFQVAQSAKLAPVPGVEDLLKMGRTDMPQTMHKLMSISDWLWQEPKLA
jgi:hypothetical protein